MEKLTWSFPDALRPPDMTISSLNEVGLLEIFKCQQNQRNAQ